MRKAKPLGYHVTVIGPKSARHGRCDVRVEDTREFEDFWVDEFDIQASAGWFETYEEARDFARKVFKGYRIAEE